MVVSEITSGLGNQLFQYAAGRALAARLGTSLCLDASFYQYGPSPRQLLLPQFNVQGRYATYLERTVLQRSLRPPGKQAIDFLRRLAPGLVFKELRETVGEWTTNFFSIAGSVYLRGYWESEKYFAGVAEELRSELTLRAEPDPENCAALAAIDAAESVALHVRRGDIVREYSSDKVTCGLDYYRAAVTALVAAVPRPHFFVFSDDPAWTQGNIRLDFPTTYFTHNVGGRDAEDLRLMSRCRHFITANSTFSWWGAWLGAYPGKRVFTPACWYPNRPTPPYLLPESWTPL